MLIFGVFGHMQALHFTMILIWEMFTLHVSHVPSIIHR